MKIALISSIDLIMFPITLFLLVLFTKYMAKKNYGGHTFTKYMLPALYVRIIGFILSTIMYQYYYDGGDVFYFYEGALIYKNTIIQNPIYGLKLFFTSANSLSSLDFEHIGNKLQYLFQRETANLLMRGGAILSFFTFGSYMAIGIIMTYFSFWGCWKLYLAFIDFYPTLEKEMAIAILFLPSVCFWGAGGLVKETILIGALGYFIYAFSMGFVRKKWSIVIFIQLVTSFILLVWIKIYVAMVLIPLILMWCFLMYKNFFKLLSVKIIAFSLVGVISLLLVIGVAKNDEKFNVGNIVSQSFHYQEYATKMSQLYNGSSYDFGNVDKNIVGIVKTIPHAINVALFRPYVWEVKKLILIPIVVESLALLIFTVFCFIKIVQAGFLKTMKEALQLEIIFCIIFSLILLFIAGFTSYNFGALARYRTPALPFFMISLIVLLNATKKKSIA